MFSRKKNDTEVLLRESLETTKDSLKRVSAECDNLKNAIRNIRKALSASDHVDAEIALSIVDAATFHLVPRRLTPNNMETLERIMSNAAENGDVESYKEIKWILKSV